MRQSDRSSDQDQTQPTPVAHGSELQEANSDWQPAATSARSFASRRSGTSSMLVSMPHSAGNLRFLDEQGVKRR